MVRLAKEIDFADRFPDCAIGAMPPLGNFYDVPTYVDRSLTKQKEIVFRLGSHRQSMRISWVDYERLAQPLLVDIINRDDRHSPPDDLRRAA